MKIVVNIQGIVKRVEIAEKIVITVEDMPTYEVHLIVNTRGYRRLQYRIRSDLCMN